MALCANNTGIKVVRVFMLFSLIAVFGSWRFGDRRDDEILMVKAFKKSYTFIYVYIATWYW